MAASGAAQSAIETQAAALAARIEVAALPLKVRADLNERLSERKSFSCRSY
jgi:hypothetical protein